MDTQRDFCDDRIFLFHGGRINGREAYADIRPLVFIFNRQKKFLEPGGASLEPAKPIQVVIQQSRPSHFQKRNASMWFSGQDTEDHRNATAGTGGCDDYSNSVVRIGFVQTKSLLSQKEISSTAAAGL
jgi:hypothetical protein